MIIMDCDGDIWKERRFLPGTFACPQLPNSDSRTLSSIDHHFGPITIYVEATPAQDAAARLSSHPGTDQEN